VSARPTSGTIATGVLDGRLTPIIAVLVASLAAAAVAASPWVAVGIALVTGAAVLLASRWLPGLFLTAVGVLLVGYAFFGRSFAYLGVAPVYAGEMVLALAALVIIRTATRRWLRLELLIVAFMAWGLARTVPFIASDGIDALRDGVLWGYALFALALSVTVRREHFERMRGPYAFLIPLFIAWVGFSAALSYAQSLPTIPGTNVAVVYFKGGDMGVHLAGSIAFLIAGLWPGSPGAASLLVTLLLPLWLVSVAVAGSLNRGGLFSALSGWSAAVFIRPPARWWSAFAVAVLLFATAAVVDPNLDVGRARTVSVDQIVTNMASVLMSTGDDKLDATRDFRLRWWRDILDYTIVGPYFWTGKGFGVNLADDDGYQVKTDGSLRAPHNTHLTVLARMGVPGLVIWLLLLFGFGIQLVRAFLASRKAGATFWCRIDAWLFAYWVAMLVNTSFDPYLEGPQGGIWFWAVMGLGFAAMRAQMAYLRPGAPREAEA
jgi:O-antigen ligase/polysaccharide polymerase Wzy-like membrane protein